MTESWDRFADAYHDAVRIAEGAFHLGPNGTPLDIADLLPTSNARTLDLGCGTGYNARAVAQYGASVVAVDSSAEQLKQARALTPAHTEITYVHADLVEYLGACERGAFDLIYGVFSLEYVDDLGSVFVLARNALANGGRFFYCDLHPFASGADLVEVTPEGFMATLRYFDEGQRPFTWRAGGREVMMVRQHRTLGRLLTWAVNAEFRLVSVMEPPVEPSADSPYLDQTIAQQQAVWASVPYTLGLLMEVA